jgi:hypothetical protein
VLAAWFLRERVEAWFNLELYKKLDKSSIESSYVIVGGVDSRIRLLTIFEVRYLV